MHLTDEIDKLFDGLRKQLEKTEESLKALSVGEQVKFQDLQKSKDEHVKRAEDKAKEAAAAREAQLDAEERTEVMEQKYEDKCDEVKRLQDENKKKEQYIEKLEREAMSAAKAMEAQRQQSGRGGGRSGAGAAGARDEDGRGNRRGGDGRAAGAGDGRGLALARCSVGSDHERDRAEHAARRGAAKERNSSMVASSPSRPSRASQSRSNSQGSASGPAAGDQKDRNHQRGRPEGGRGGAGEKPAGRGGAPAGARGEERRSVSPGSGVIAVDSQKPQEDDRRDSRRRSRQWSPRSRSIRRRRSPTPDEDRRRGPQDSSRGPMRSRSRDRRDPRDMRDRGSPRRSRPRSWSRTLERRGGCKGGGKGKENLCFLYVIGKCHKGSQCPNRHPDAEEVTRMKERMERTPCKYGADCTRRDCVFLHPKGWVPQSGGGDRRGDDGPRRDTDRGDERRGDYRDRDRDYDRGRGDRDQDRDFDRDRGYHRASGPEPVE